MRWIKEEAKDITLRPESVYKWLYDTRKRIRNDAKLMRKLIKVPKAAFRGERYKLEAIDGNGKILPQSLISHSLLIKNATKDDALLEEFE